MREGTPERLRRRLRGDLDAILLKALRKLARDRYPSVEALADDLGRHLAGRPVSARRGTWRYQAGKFVRRHRAPIAVGCALAALGALALWLAWRPETPPATSATAESPQLVVQRPRPVLAVVGLRSSSSSSSSSSSEDPSWLGAALGEMVRHELAAGHELRTLPAELVAEAHLPLPSPEEPAYSAAGLSELRGRLPVDFVATGTYALRGGDGGGPLVVELWVQDVASGRIVARAALDGDARRPGEMVRRLGGELRAALGLAPPNASAPPARPPEAAAAARAYTEGLLALRAHDALGARERLALAAELAPENVLVRRALARAWEELGHRRKQEEAARRAHQLASGLDPSERLEIEVDYRRAAEDWQRAHELSVALCARFPDDLEHGLRQVSIELGRFDPAAARATLARLRALPPPSRGDPRLDLAEARAAFHVPEYGRGREAAERAVEASRRLGRPALLADALLCRSAALVGLGDSEGALAAAAEGLSVAGAARHPRLVGRAHDLAAHIHWRRADLGAAAREAELALAAGEASGNQAQIALISTLLASIRSENGDAEGALALSDRAARLARETGDRRSEKRAIGDSSQALLRLGRVGEAQARLETMLALSRQTADRHSEALALNSLGEVARLLGDLRLAERRGRDAVALADEFGEPLARSFCAWNLASTLHARGELAAARRELEPLVESAARNGNAALSARVQVSLGEVLADGGDFAGALRLARSASAALEGGVPAGKIMAANLSMRAALAAGQLEEARAAARGVREQLGPAGAIGLDLRWRAEILLARVDGASGTDGQERVRRRLEAVLAEAGRSGIASIELEARQALGEELLASAPAEGRAMLEETAKEADERGWGLIAAQARARAAGNVQASASR